MGSAAVVAAEPRAPPGLRPRKQPELEFNDLESREFYGVELPSYSFLLHSSGRVVE